jgi:hypothetical protein
MTAGGPTSFSVVSWHGDKPFPQGAACQPSAVKAPSTTPASLGQ